MDRVEIGIVSSINKKQRTARVRLKDEDVVSGELKVIQNVPFVANKETELIYGVEMESGHVHKGKTEKHTHEIIVEPWMPRIGELVLCLYCKEDGFIIGGI